MNFGKSSFVRSVYLLREPKEKFESRKLLLDFWVVRYPGGGNFEEFFWCSVRIEEQKDFRGLEIFEEISLDFFCLSKLKKDLNHILRARI